MLKNFYLSAKDIKNYYSNNCFKKALTKKFY